MGSAPRARTGLPGPAQTAAGAGFRRGAPEGKPQAGLAEALIVGGLGRALPMAARTHSSNAGGDPSRELDVVEGLNLEDLRAIFRRRRILFAATFVFSLLAGAAFTYFTPPEYESKATVYTLEHSEVIHGWLQSAQAAEHAVIKVGDPLNPILFPEDWDPSAGTWRGPIPPTEVRARALLKHVTISDPVVTVTTTTPRVAIVVALPDPTVARDVASAYVDSLDTLRPILENITRSVLFDKYYDGSNAQEAQRRAESVANEKAYWLVFDKPALPSLPTKPRPVLYMSVAASLGLVAGAILVLTVDRVSRAGGTLAPPELPPP